MILRNTAVVLKTSSFVRRARVCNDIVQLNIGKLVAEINLIVFFFMFKEKYHTILNITDTARSIIIYTCGNIML